MKSIASIVKSNDPGIVVKIAASESGATASFVDLMVNPAVR